MNQFGPTRGEMKFRLAVSLLGLAIFAVAVLLRGLPIEPENLRLAGLVAAFLVASAGLSGIRLRLLDGD